VESSGKSWKGGGIGNLTTMVTSNPLCAFAKPHDLLELASPESIDDLEGAPAWVHASLLACPYVVVRRQPPARNGIAIGVRGESRNQRWPGIVSPDRVKTIISPFELRAGTTIKPERLEAIPALRHLLALEKEWCSLALKWGPGGSVGFELASTYPAATPLSDLDIVLFAPTCFDYDFARSLLLSVRQIASCIDVLVETLECAFSLSEYADSQGHPILLRCLDKPRIAVDPWCIENESLLSDSLLAELETPV
jgi:phosphoribosyl-dephospho-CoA transferase